jgi:hypothetical protein
MYWQIESTAPIARSPELAMQDRLADFELSSEQTGILAVPFLLDQYWLEEPAPFPLMVVYRFDREAGGTRISVAFSEAVEEILAELDGAQPTGKELIDRLHIKFNMIFFDLDSPLDLGAVKIPKPWGQEIWYTGIEQRGLSNVLVGEYSVPLPWLLSAASRKITGSELAELVLLKILDPLPDEVYGDLYFELHEKKREVYVVTHVDEVAWPQGKGKIRFGFNRQVRNNYPDNESFKKAFLDSVKQYEKLRREIDTLLARSAAEAGYISGQLPSTAQIKEWTGQLPDALLEQERTCRKDMESFTGELQLAVGDVLQVPCHVPHSLQHGVRTVEFQTPVYERLIISFAQKVLTQEHWDTEQAIELMQLDRAEPDLPQMLVDRDGILVERIVDFEDFEVQRVKLGANTRYTVPSRGHYQLLMTIKGAILLDQKPVAIEQACLIPAGCQSPVLENNNSTEAFCLVATPH